MPTSLGPAEILVILVVALIVLGPKKLPEAGRQVGKAIAEVRRWSQGFQDEIRSTIDPDATRPSYPTPPTTTPEAPIPVVSSESPPPPPAASGTVTTGSHGLVSGPPPADTAPGAPAEPSGPPAGEPPTV